MNTQKTEGLELSDIGDLSELLNDPKNIKDKTTPLELPLERIEEDPNQPRTEDNPGFSKLSLEELAITIQHRGVKTPISVRENQEKPDHFIINHGARRYRSSKIAQKETIPAFIDNDYNEADQVIENLQRNELTAREIANYIGRELAKNIKKSDIASTIGKSAAFVSQHITLLDLPDPIAETFNSGRTNDVTVINELVKAYKKNPDKTTTWLNDDKQDLTRSSVKLLRDYLNEKHNLNTINVLSDQNNGNIDNFQEEKPQKSALKKAPKEQSPEKLKNTIIMIKHNQQTGRLIFDRRPTMEGLAWIKYENGKELEVSLKKIKLVTLLDGV